MVFAVNPTADKTFADFQVSLMPVVAHMSTDTGCRAPPSRSLPARLRTRTTCLQSPRTRPCLAQPRTMALSALCVRHLIGGCLQPSHWVDFWRSTCRRTGSVRVCIEPVLRYDVLLVRRAVRGLMEVIGIRAAYSILYRFYVLESDRIHSLGVSTNRVRLSAEHCEL